MMHRRDCVTYHYRDSGPVKPIRYGLTSSGLPHQMIHMRPQKSVTIAIPSPGETVNTASVMSSNLLRISPWICAQEARTPIVKHWDALFREAPHDGLAYSDHCGHAPS